MASGTYWFLACSCEEQSRENIYSVLRSRLHKHGLVTDVTVFDVPLDLKFGSFDDLIRLADDLAKHDTTCEQIVRRLEKQILDIDPQAEPRIIFQRNAIPVEQYLQRFIWDEARYPKSRYLRDSVDLLMGSLTRMDDEIRIKSAAFNDANFSQQAIAKKEGSSFIQRDLIDVLTADKVAENDFVETEHLTTVVVVVPKGSSEVWLSNYEKMDPFVVPKSTKKFEAVDKEGNTLWKVTLFKTSIENFRTAAKTKRFTVRDFTYKKGALEAVLAERSKLEAEKNKMEVYMTRVCLASFSDAAIAWTHIKAMRVFVEATLRYGVPPRFATCLLKPVLSKEKKLRKELEDIFTTEGMFGRAYVEKDKHQTTETNAATAALLAELGGEEYYPYVYFSLTPFGAFVQR